MHVYEDALSARADGDLQAAARAGVGVSRRAARARPRARRRRPADRLRLRQPLHAGRARRARPRGARDRRRRRRTSPTPSSQSLHDAGVRGVRYMMLPGGVLPWSGARARRRRAIAAARLAHRPAARRPRAAAARGDAARACRAGSSSITSAASWARSTPDSDPVRALLRLLDTGRAGSRSRRRTKARAAGRRATTTSPGSRGSSRERYPERCLWASNWPHPNRTRRRANAAMLDWGARLLRRRRRRRSKALVDNPAELYGFAPSRRHVNFAQPSDSLAWTIPETSTPSPRRAAPASRAWSRRCSSSTRT